MSDLKRPSEELEDLEAPPTVLVISDSDSDSGGEDLTGFSSPQKRSMIERLGSNANRMEPSLAKKRVRTDTADNPNEEAPIDIDSVSTNPLRTRTKVSSDTSSKFPVSSPSDTVPLAGHRKKYVKNTLPAGAEWRLLQETATGQPVVTYREKVNHWICREELSDVEDVNSFDTEFQKREALYSKNLSGRRSSGKDFPYPNYNYQHFRSVILEALLGSPVHCTQESGRNSSSSSPQMQPSCSKERSTSARNEKADLISGPLRPGSKGVAIYEKILGPSSESSATKTSPSIRLHWTDEESVFRLNRLNPDIDKYSKLIKVRIDYNKKIDFKKKINEIFKTPTVPVKYHSPPLESRNSTIKGVAGKSLNVFSPETKSIIHHIPVQELPQRNIQTRRSTGGKSSESRRSSERISPRDRRSIERRVSGRRSNDRRSSERFPELNCFQQDEFCNYLGLGMNGKVYSPTPTDNKRRSLRVKRLLVSSQPLDQKNKDRKKELKKKKDQESKEKEENENEESREMQIQEIQITDDINEIRCCHSSVDNDTKFHENLSISNSPKSIPSVFSAKIPDKPPEIKIIAKLNNNAIVTPSKADNTPSSIIITTTPPQATARRQLRARATSNGTSTCPRSSQSDECPEKLTPIRRRRVNQHQQPHLLDHGISDLSESLQSDPNPVPQTHPNTVDNSLTPQHNGRSSTVPSSLTDEKKDESIEIEVKTEPQDPENPNCVHKKYQRFLEESRKSKPSIVIVEAINFCEIKKTPPMPLPLNSQPTNTQKPERLSKEKKNRKHLHSNKRVRHLLRRNGTVIGTLHQRMLRSRIINRTDKKQSKHLMNKKMKKLNSNLSITKQNKASQIDIPEVDDAESKTEVQSSLATAQMQEKDVPTIPNVVEEKESQSVILETHDSEVQTDSYVPPMPINFLTSPSNRMPNPLTPKNGRVIYAYHELDILIIVQDFMVTFWKTCKLIQVLGNKTEEWMQLGECKRLLYDTEIEAPHKNRICVHNSIPIYMEMRAKELPKLNRECVLISIYVNVYYFDDEDMAAKSHSIQLDTMASFPQNVVYTTITDSRYFVMCWSQETPIGKSLSGLCKYSLTPHLDTLASIREFKSMRHEIRYLECTTDDNLIGFGDSQVTLWDHRSGDILMNYDLDMKIGKNLGSLHFAPLEVGQAKTVLVFQKTSPQELSIIAINVSHNAPSHQMVCKHTIPTEFDNLKSSIGIDDYTILTNTEHQELWIDHSDPQYLVQIKTPEGQKRFYSRCKQNVIVITENHLSLETFSSFVLKMNTWNDNI